MTLRPIGRREGFTLIELMIVVAIIGVLAAIAIPKFGAMIQNSRDGTTKGNLGAIRSALSLYYGEQSNYPNSCGSPGMPINGYDDNSSILNDTLVPKYMSQIPVVRTKNHPESNQVLDLWISPTDSLMQHDWDGDPGFSNPYPIAWEYAQNCNWNGAFVAVTGQIRVSCFHTDSKGSNWSGY